MRRMIALSMFCSVVLISGCLPVLSIYPLYDKRTSILDARLIGDWVEEDGMQFIFRQRGEKSYEMVVTDAGKRAVLDAHLLQLRGQYYLDLYPNPDSLESALEGLAFALDTLESELSNESHIMYGLNLTILQPFHTFSSDFGPLER